jgi:CBS domain containing-hemolysin-like protein
MYRLAGALRLLVALCHPLTWPLKQLFRLLTRGMDAEPGRELHRLSPDGLKEYFSVGAREGLISPDQTRMMDNATSMHSLPVRTLMTPLKKIPSLPASATVADFKRLCARRQSAYALLMDRHRVVGLVSLFGIVNRKFADDQSLRPCAEDVLEIRENRNLKSAFYRLRRNPRHSAVVVDARHHPVGYLHLEAIARYIAGE